MNRAELIEALATRSGVTKVTADKVVAELLDIIGDTLAAGDKLTLVGFGAFSVGWHQRSAHWPQPEDWRSHGHPRQQKAQIYSWCYPEG